MKNINENIYTSFSLSWFFFRDMFVPSANKVLVINIDNKCKMANYINR